MADQATPVVTKSWTLPGEHLQIRLDAFVRQCLPHLSRREIEIAIRQGLFCVGAKVSKKGDRLTRGDQLVFSGPANWLASSPHPDAQLDVPIVYDDASILVVNKPAGMPTHGFSGRHEGTLANFLLAHSPNLINVGKNRWQPGLVHRLDRETSGLVVVAKTQAAFDDLTSQFRRRRIKKIYWALVQGVTPLEGVIDMSLEHHPGDKRRMRVARRSHRRTTRIWKAVTRYRCIGQSSGLSLLEVDMETGVTHQIRVHLAAIGHPIIGDVLYGDKGAKDFGLRRHFLHAHSLTMMRPNNGRELTVEAALTEDLAEVLKRLGFDI